MIKHKFYLRTTRTNKSGTSALYFRINTRPSAWVATGVFIHLEYWNQADQQLLRCPDYNRISAQLNNLKSKADLYLLKLEHDNRRFNQDDFVRSVVKGNLNDTFNPLLSDLIREYTDVNKIGWGRIRHYEVFKSQLADFAPGARLQAVDYQFGKRFEKFLSAKGNHINTVGNKLKMLKAVVHYAMQRNIISVDPLQSLRVSVRRSRRTALTQEELLKLHQMFEAGDHLTGGQLQTLRNFLFSCYTGLRYSDLRTLRHTDIKNDFIYIDMHKTGTPVSVPVMPRARALLQYMPGNRCFEVFTNEATNRHLKDIADVAGLEKVLSFHVSRHTFATISLQLGIGLKFVSEILGHSSVKITEQYLHVLDDMKMNEMLKWQKFTA